MTNNYLNVYFDESGKDKKEISLMGALCIPDNVYKNTKKINDLNQKLKTKEFKLHFTEYKKENFHIYRNVLNAFVECENFIKINIVAYKKDSHIDENKKRFKNIVHKMVYKKIPERVLYGILRDYGNFSDVEANLFIERSGEYEELKLHKNVKEELNIHSIYRHENFWVNKAVLYPKNTELGIEAIDTFLGIVRIIATNNSCATDTENFSMNLWNKKIFISKMLSDKNFYNFLCQINYFELDGQAILEQKNFKDYINLFLSKFLQEKVQLNLKNGI